MNAADTLAPARADAADEPFTVAGRRVPWPALVGVVVTAFVLLVVRRTSGLSAPNLWAEDGPIFLRAAYLDPAYRSVWDPYNGYLHLLLRAWAELTTLLPVRALALSYSVFNLALFPLSYSVLLSRRLRWLIPSDTIRLIGFFALVLLPGTREITGNLTSAIWPIAIALLLLSLCLQPATPLGRGGEHVAVAAFGLTGPSCLLVWPGFALRWWRERSRHNLALLATNLTTCAVQGLLLLFTERSEVAGSFAPRTIVRAVVVRVWGTLSLGEETLRDVVGKPLAPWVLGVCALVIVVTVAAFVALPWSVRLHLGAVFVLSLATTAWAYNGDLRPMAEGVDSGRYFLIPMALVVLVVLAAASRRHWRLPQLRAVLLVPATLLFVFASAVDFNLPELASTRWPQVAACIRSHRVCRVTVNPPSFSFDLPPVPDVG